LGHQVEVHIVASFSVNSHNVNIIESFKGAISILGSEFLTIVTGFGINSLCFGIKVVSPLLEIEGNHRVLFGEILGIWSYEVMVSFKWI
jgi:hypothetical protein